MEVKFFCVNMKDAAERRAHCEQLFAKAGINVQFVDGINNKQMGLEHVKLKRGKIGCYLSFYQLYEEIIRHNYGVCVIFEDDIQLAENFAAQLQQALPLLPDDWETAYIGWWPGWWNYNQIKTQMVNDNWLKITEGVIWGGYGQVINGHKGAAKMREALSTMRTAFDDQMFAAVTSGRVNGYFMREPIVTFTNLFPSQTTT